MFIETVGAFWFAVISVLAIVGPLAVFVISFAVAAWRNYSLPSLVLCVVLTGLALAPALAFMFTQWTLSTESSSVSSSFSDVGWAGFGILVFWVVGGWALAWVIDNNKKG